MMRLPRPRQNRKSESTIALINIVFLMLIFFLIAGTLAPPMDAQVALIRTANADPAEPPDSLFVTGDGRLRVRGVETDVGSFVAHLRASQLSGEADGPSVKLAADRSLPATQLVDIVGQLRAAGVGEVAIVTERAAE